jgi:hypothetical protein
MAEQKTIIDDEGVERVIPEVLRKQKCSVCGKAIKPLWKITKDPEDWLWQECDICLEPCCSDCSDRDEKTGLIECCDCYGFKMAKEIKHQMYAVMSLDRAIEYAKTDAARDGESRYVFGNDNSGYYVSHDCPTDRRSFVRVYPNGSTEDGTISWA